MMLPCFQLLALLHTSILKIEYSEDTYDNLKKKPLP